MTRHVDSFLVREFSGLAGLAEIQDAWRFLEERNRAYFLEYSWFRESIINDYRQDVERRFFLVQDFRGDVIGIVPLEQRIEKIRRLPVRIWALVGSRSGDVVGLASSADFLAASDELAMQSLRAVVAHLQNAHPDFGLLLLGRMNDQSRAFIAANKFTDAIHYSRGAVDWIDTNRMYAQLEKGLSRKFRASLRNTNNRARREGPVETVVLDGGSERVEAYEEFKRIEARGWKGAKTDNRALALNRLPFERDFLASIVLGKGGDCRPKICQLRLNSHPIATMLTVQYKKVLVALKITYDEKYSALGPGHLLVKGLLEDCCADPSVEGVDFVSHTPWVSAWNPVIRPHYWSYLPLNRNLKTLAATTLLKWFPKEGGR